MTVHTKAWLIALLLRCISQNDDVVAFYTILFSTFRGLDIGEYFSVRHFALLERLAYWLAYVGAANNSAG
jgi:hypothetical protein